MIFTEQRFYPFTLQDLIQLDNETVRNYTKQSKTIKDLADRVIIDIEYPFHLGQPDDKHDINNFHGHYCTSITLDYWQTAEETLFMKKGDCEDSSIAFVTCALLFGLNDDVVFEVLGVVQDADTDQILGGHGWSYFMLDGKMRLYESTLDVPPEYPVIDDIMKPYRLESIVYVPQVLFNKVHEYIIEPSPFVKVLGRKSEIEKHKRIAEAWKQDTKLTKKLKVSKLYKLRKRLGLIR